MYLYVQFPILCHDNVVLIVLLGLGFFFLQTWLGSVLKTSSGFTPTDVETLCYTVISDSPTFQHDSSYTCNVDTI